MTRNAQGWMLAGHATRRPSCRHASRRSGQTVAMISNAHGWALAYDRQRAGQAVAMTGDAPGQALWMTRDAQDPDTVRARQSSCHDWRRARRGAGCNTHCVRPCAPVDRQRAGPDAAMTRNASGRGSGQLAMGEVRTSGIDHSGPMPCFDDYVERLFNLRHSTFVIRPPSFVLFKQ